jgi:hypothetical protein
MDRADARFREAAAVYFGYGVVYWLGGLALASAGFGPRGSERGRLAWFVAGALFVVVIPWLLRQERPWFNRWVLSRRDFGRVLAVLVAFRAVEVARIALGPPAPAVPVLGLAVPFGLGAWLFCALTVLTAAALARAAWTRER